MENNRLGQASPKAVKFIKETLRALKKQGKMPDVLIAEPVEAEKTSSRKVEIMESVKGMGPIAISTFAAELPELGELNRGQIAKLVRVAPINDDSGQHKGTQNDGRAKLRSSSALHGSSGCNKAQCKDQRFLPAASVPGQAKKTGLGYCDAEAADDHQHTHQTR